MELTQDVLDVLHDNNISQEELHEMLRQAAIITHTLGNRRFHNWLFRIRGGVCEGMYPWIREVHKRGTIDLTIHEECEHCEGVGCGFCDNVGEVRVIYQPQSQRSAKHVKKKRKHPQSP